MQTVTVVQLRNTLCVELLWMVGLHRTGRPAGQSPWRRLSHPIGDPIGRPYWCRIEKLLMRLFLLISRFHGKLLIHRAWTLKLHSRRRRLVRIIAYALHKKPTVTAVRFAVSCFWSLYSYNHIRVKTFEGEIWNSWLICKDVIPMNRISCAALSYRISESLLISSLHKEMDLPIIIPGRYNI